MKLSTIASMLLAASTAAAAAVGSPDANKYVKPGPTSSLERYRPGTKLFMTN